MCSKFCEKLREKNKWIKIIQRHILGKFIFIHENRKRNTRKILLSPEFVSGSAPLFDVGVREMATKWGKELTIDEMEIQRGEILVRLKRNSQFALES